MDRLRKLRNSAIFIDMLLIVGAVAAIVGLATFVHLRGMDKTGHAEQQSLTQSTNSYEAPLPTTDSDAGSSSAAATNNVVKPDDTSNICTTDCSLPEETEQVISASCDEAKRQLVMSTYTKDIAKENTLYQSSLSLLGSPLTLAGKALQEASSLLHSHEQKIAEFTSAAYQQLKLLKCPTNLL